MDAGQQSKQKLKNAKRTTNGFVSFSAVSGGSGAIQSSGSAVAPVYIGSDSELSQASQKLIKKDSVTKLKALNEVISIMRDRGANVIGDFLPYFVHVYCRLTLDNDRQVREQINTLLGVIVSIDKKQLTPYMKRLIGYWWLQTCDPVKEVARIALTAFHDAIPSKKAQQVLAYLAPDILHRTSLHLGMTATALNNDMAVNSPEEAEEKFERVVVSSLGCIGALIKALSAESNAQLVQGVAFVAEEGSLDEDSESLISYRRLFSDIFWDKYLTQSSSYIRGAASALLISVADNAPDLLSFGDSSPKSAKQFCSRVLSLLDEPYENILCGSLDAFISTVRSKSWSWELVSVHKQLVPKLRQLLKTHPEQGLDYLVPILGALPAKNVALCQVTATHVDSEADKDVDALCGLLRLVSDIAERFSASATNQTNRLNASAEILAAKADVCVAELGTLLLLRRSPATDDAHPVFTLSDLSTVPGKRERLEAVVGSVVQAIVLCLQTVTNDLAGRDWISAATLMGSGAWSHVGVDRLAIQWTARPGAAVHSDLSWAKTDLIRSVEHCSKLLLQLQRATTQEINLSRDLWKKLLWQPLSTQVGDLLRANCNPLYGVDAIGTQLPGGSTDEIETRVGRVVVNLVCAVKSLFFLLDEALKEGADGALGAQSVIAALVTLSRQSLSDLGGKSDEKLLQQSELLEITSCLVLTKFLMETYSRRSEHCLDSLFGALELGATQILDQVTSAAVHTAIVLLNKRHGAGLPEAAHLLLTSTLVDSFHFLATEVSSETDKLLFAGRILTSGVNLNSVYAVTAFLSCDSLCADFQWESHDSLARWIADAALCLLADKANNSTPPSSMDSETVKQLHECSVGDSLHFLMFVVKRSNFQALANDLIKTSELMWEQESSRLAELFLLTLLCNSLSNAVHITSTHTVASNPANWVSANSQTLLRKLTKLFFARDRDSIRHGADCAKSSHETAVFGMALVESWEAAEQFLLPILPENLAHRLMVHIGDELNSHLLHAAGDSALDGHNLQPRKWVRHICALVNSVKRLRATSGVTVKQSVASVALFQPSFWAEISDEMAGAQGGTRISFALNCLLQIEELADRADMSWVPLQGNHELLYELLLCLEIGRNTLPMDHGAPVDAALSYALRLFSAASQAEQAQKLTSVLNFSLKEVTARQTPCEELVQKLLLVHFATSELHRLEQISIHTPLPSDRLEKGAHLFYIMATDGAPDQNGVVVRTFQAVPARVLAVHKEAGTEPYYSVEISGPLSSAPQSSTGSRELQTEWHKLLVAHSGGDAADLVGTIVPNTEFPSAVPAATGCFPASCAVSAPQRAVGDWLATQVQEIARRMLDKSSNFLKMLDSTSLLEQQHQVRLYCSVFVTYSRFVDHNFPSSAKQHFSAAVVSLMRGLSTFLVALNHDAYRAAWTTGIELLKALLSTNIGVGAGLWLPKVLATLKVVVSSELKLKQVTSGGQSEQSVLRGDELLSSLSLTVGDLLSAVHWTACLSLAEQLLPLALPSLPSPDQHLAPSILKLAKSVWMNRQQGKPLSTSSREQAVSSLSHLESSLLDSLVPSWEVEAFDLALFVFVEGLRSHSEAVRLEASSALHFCLLGRSRRSCAALLEPSLIAEMVSQLEDIVRSPQPPIVTSGSRTLISLSVWSTMRVTASKLLDVYVANNSVLVDEDISSEQPQESEEFSVAELEQAEFSADEQVFRRCMGDSLDSQLEARFSTSSLQQLVRASSSVSEASSVGEERDEPEDDFAAEIASESVSVKASSVQSSASPQSKRSVEFGTRRVLHAMQSSDPLGSVLHWLLCLQRIDALSVRSWSLRARCGNYLKKSGIMRNVLSFLMHCAGDLLKQRDVAALLQRIETVNLQLSPAERKQQELADKVHKSKSSSSPSSMRSIDVGSLQQLAVYGLFRSVCTLPAMFRTFWSDDCSRLQKLKLEQFVEERVRVSLISREMALIAQGSAAGRWDEEEFKVRGSVVSGEITAVFTKEETSMEIRIKLPPSYPLKNVEVTCTSKIGVSDGRWRRWVLQMIQLLSLQDGSVVDAALMWKCNIEKELEGVEPCPICYCILHTKTLALPTLSCPTCNNKFHNNCLFTWFKSSGKSKCVICQQPFFDARSMPRAQQQMA